MCLWCPVTADASDTSDTNDSGDKKQLKDSFDIHKRIYFSGTLVANWAALGSS